MPSSSIFLFGFVIVGVLGIVDESVVMVRLILKCCFCREYWMSSSCSYSSFKMKLLPTSFPRLSTSTSTSLRSFWGISEDYCNFLSRINMNIFLGKTRFEFWWLLWFRFLGLVFAPSKTAICLHLWERTLGILFIFAPSLSLSKLEIVLWENSLWICGHSDLSMELMFCGFLISFFLKGKPTPHLNIRDYYFVSLMGFVFAHFPFLFSFLFVHLKLGNSLVLLYGFRLIWPTTWVLLNRVVYWQGVMMMWQDG